VRHSTPERVLLGNLRLPSANLLKREQLKKNPFDPVAVEQPEVSAGAALPSAGADPFLILGVKERRSAP
jgi:hypothetical protein